MQAMVPSPAEEETHANLCMVNWGYVASRY